jgi:hypothetical protein
MHARISVRRPDSNLSLQGTGVPIDLLAIANYQGWIYHEYQKMVGKRRREIVGEFVEGGGYGEMVEEGMGGPDSEGADIIRNLVNLAKRAADAEFLEWLEGMEEYQPKIAGVPVGEPIKLSHVYTFDEYAEAIGIAKELDRAEYQIKKLKEIRAEGFYKVDKPKPDIYMSPQGKKALEDVGVPTTF